MGLPMAIPTGLGSVKPMAPVLELSDGAFVGEAVDCSG